MPLLLGKSLTEVLIVHTWGKEPAGTMILRGQKRADLVGADDELT